MRHALYSAGMLLVLASLSTPLVATAVPVPEIDGGSIGSIVAGLGLLGGGITLIRARWRAK